MSDLKLMTDIPDNDREDGWENNLLDAMALSRVNVLYEELQQGPDGWPYMYVESSADATESVMNILNWLTEKGAGLVLNPQKERPDYVFTYGMIWNFSERGQFITPAQTSIESGSVDLQPGTAYRIGQPTDEYLPPYVRQIIKQFFKDQGVENPRIALLSFDQKHFDLCFSLESLGSPPESEFPGIGEAISWFVPNHYSVMLLNESEFPGFENL